MAAALNAWALQANTQVFVDPGPVARLRAPAVKGSLTPRQALRALLARSNLVVSRGANGVFVVKPRPLVAAAPAPTPRTEPAPPPAPAPPLRAPLSARDSDGPWLLGLSAVYASDAGHARTGATLALAAEYFITDHVAGALDVTLPRTHSFDDASARLQSTAVRLKYYFLPEGAWDPYLAAGVNVTAIYAASGVSGLDHVTAGPTLEAGFDVRLNPRWLLNAAVGWAQVRPAADGLQGRDIRIDPVQFALGFVYRF
ncbi:MAG TPA: OmpW family outer membrane protein [Steroidobacteraceae bacterium]|jgi:outer membrane protein|nr:OmpW family outer membrane protein [Steroidobacteraceae bacterium]